MNTIQTEDITALQMEYLEAGQFSAFYWSARCVWTRDNCLTEGMIAG